MTYLWLILSVVLLPFKNYYHLRMNFLCLQQLNIDGLIRQEYIGSSLVWNSFWMLDPISSYLLLIPQANVPDEVLSFLQSVVVFSKCTIITL